MTTRGRLVAFAAALVVAFGAAAAVGAAVGPIDVGGETPMNEEPGMNQPGSHDPATHLGTSSTMPEP